MTLPGEEIKGAYGSQLDPQAHGQFQDNNLAARLQTASACLLTINRGKYWRKSRRGGAAIS
jgi:hypothetical protein